MRDLIARLEAAQGPDRELDGEIAVAVQGGEIVWKQANYTMEMYPSHRYASTNHYGGFANEHVPLFTASIDAALTLVPDGWSWSLYDVIGKPESVRMWRHPMDVLTSAATPALALCIAALKARSNASRGPYLPTPPTRSETAALLVCSVVAGCGVVWMVVALLLWVAGVVL